MTWSGFGGRAVGRKGPSRLRWGDEESEGRQGGGDPEGGKIAEVVQLQAGRDCCESSSARVTVSTTYWNGDEEAQQKRGKGVKVRREQGRKGIVTKRREEQRRLVEMERKRRKETARVRLNYQPDQKEGRRDAGRQRE